MSIPNAASAYVPPDKVSEYLLDENHPIGGSKAKWFIGLGYDPADPTRLEQDLLKQVQVAADFEEKASAHGTKYVVSGKITTPSAAEANVTTVWIVDPFDNRPRLVTAFPGAKS